MELLIEEFNIKENNDITTKTYLLNVENYEELQKHNFNKQQIAQILKIKSNETKTIKIDNTTIKRITLLNY